MPRGQYKRKEGRQDGVCFLRAGVWVVTFNGKTRHATAVWNDEMMDPLPRGARLVPREGHTGLVMFPDDLVMVMPE